MGTWNNRINLIDPGESGSYAYDKAAMNLLFCFSQVNEKSEDWKNLVSKADQFMQKDGSVNQVNATRIEKILNDWATGKNSPLKNSDEPDVLRYSAPSYLFRGYNAMKQYFTSIGFNLEENLPNLKQEAKDCAKKVDSASAQPADLPSTEEENKKLRNYISKEYGTAFYYGLDISSARNIKPVDPYLNEIGPTRDALDRQDDLSRNKIQTIISDSYESIKDSKKWYGKDDTSYTNMINALRDYTDTHSKEAETKGISANEKEKLENAVIECSRYVEKHDGIKFTSVGAKRLNAAKKILEEMKQLPEAREAFRKLALEKAKEKAKQTTAEKRSKMAKEASEKTAGPMPKAEEKAKQKTEEKHSKAAKEAPKKSVEPMPKAEKHSKAAKEAPKKPAGPMPRAEEWFQMVSVLMKQEKAANSNFQRMDKVMEQYKTLTAKDQSRVHDMWVKQYEMGEDTWKMLKERNDIKENKERVSISFQDLKNDLKKDEGKETPKTNRMSQKVMKEPEKETLQKKKESPSL